MKCNYLPRFIIITSVIFLHDTVSFSQPVGIFDNHQDIGTNLKPGSATYIPATELKDSLSAFWCKQKKENLLGPTQWYSQKNLLVRK